LSDCISFILVFFSEGDLILKHNSKMSACTEAPKEPFTAARF